MFSTFKFIFISLVLIHIGVGIKRLMYLKFLRLLHIHIYNLCQISETSSHISTNVLSSLLFLFFVVLILWMTSMVCNHSSNWASLVYMMQVLFLQVFSLFFVWVLLMQLYYFISQTTALMLCTSDIQSLCNILNLCPIITILSLFLFSLKAMVQGIEKSAQWHGIYFPSMEKYEFKSQNYK